MSAGGGVNYQARANSPSDGQQSSLAHYKTNVHTCTSQVVYYARRTHVATSIDDDATVEIATPCAAPLLISIPNNS